MTNVHVYKSGKRFDGTPLYASIKPGVMVSGMTYDELVGAMTLTLDLRLTSPVPIRPDEQHLSQFGIAELEKLENDVAAYRAQRTK